MPEPTTPQSETLPPREVPDSELEPTPPSPSEGTEGLS